MADEEQLAILREGVETWNAWRAEHADVSPDLSRSDLREANLDRIHLQSADLREAKLDRIHLYSADLGGANLVGANLAWASLGAANFFGADLSAANLSWANLSAANLREAHLSAANLGDAHLREADLYKADLRGADLRGAHLNAAGMQKAYLREADLRGADLRGADLSGANLREADLREADLSGAHLNAADLRYATLVRTDLSEATLADCTVYGISAWDIQLAGAIQTNLSINRPGDPLITVDNLKVAQFLYLMLHNDEIRDVIDTLTSKVVLILGRFTPERKAVLDAIREALRQRNYVPVLFDFDGPVSLNTTETVTLLARMARFIIADLTEPSSLPQELQAIVPDVMVPVQPLLLDGARHHSMFPDFRRYPWMLPIYRYASLDALLTAMQEKVIAPAEAKVIEVRKLRQAEPDSG